MAVVRFATNDDRIPMPGRERAEQMIREVIQEVRPDDEEWEVCHSEPANGTCWDIDFTKDRRTERLRLFREDTDDSVLGGYIRTFLRHNWPGAVLGQTSID